MIELLITHNLYGYKNWQDTKYKLYTTELFNKQ